MTFDIIYWTLSKVRLRNLRIISHIYGKNNWLKLIERFTSKALLFENLRNIGLHKFHPYYKFEVNYGYLFRCQLARPWRLNVVLERKKRNLPSRSYSCDWWHRNLSPSLRRNSFSVLPSIFGPSDLMFKTL